MNIILDISFFPDELVSKILHSTEIESFFIGDALKNEIQVKSEKMLKFEFPGNLKEFEDLIHRVLHKNSINEYTIAQDTESYNTFTLLKLGDVNQLGIVICDFCGASFNSDDEKYIHQRAHFSF